MGPKINRLSISNLVSTAVEKRLVEEMGDYKALLNNALSNIKNLKEEMAHFRENSNNIFPILKSFIKSAVYKHWLRNQCTWQQKCRFCPTTFEAFKMVLELESNYLRQPT